ncbi:amino acid transporter [Lepidopterella palustris CBS 459.81]|uniref:Amino acid transporter n=1 Tax=Lepidopterella palustris CBS 459.81 TaxID=1314670 RepID=A0A8E2E8Z4_9PEZI|nr:amino acid transporter [Lepidopterella palustris CBS 459.81]
MSKVQPETKEIAVKHTTVEDSDHPDHPVGAESVQSEKYGTAYDERDMQRMGKLQQLRRNFRFFSIFGYAVILGNTWEFALVLGAMALTNGGTAGGIWMFLTVCVGMFFCMLSMAEMASMAPTSGGQYHWVSEFAPKEYQKFLSYLVGWLCVLGWQAAMGATSYATAQQIEGLIALNHPTYTIQGWHGALLSIGITAFCIFFNTVLARRLPLFEGIVVVLHIFGFFAFLVVLWVMAPRSDPKAVFTEFQDNAGWGNVGLSCLVGLLGPVVTLIGSDSACHLSEELKDAAWVLPRSMVATALVNYSLGFVMTITFMSTIGDVSQVLATPTGQPYIQIVLNATNSHTAATILTTVMCILLFFCSVNQVTTSSRQLFAFARDRGLPFSSFLSHVRPGWDIPLNAVTLTMIFTTLLSLIIIGSSIAFNIITSLSQVGLVSSYIIAIGCMAVKRIRKEPLLSSRFSLGKAGLPVNIIALCFLALAFVMLFFPATPKPNGVTMNWSVLIYGVVVIFALVYYYFTGRYAYVGPVEYINKNM